MPATVLFWGSLAAVVYVYFGYPALLWAWRRVAPWPARKAPWEPRLTIVIAAHDEAAHIEARVRNCLALDYPPDKLQIIVSLDCPTDGTDAILERFSGEPRLQVCRLAQHGGKAAALNAALPRVEGEVIVFADARQRFALDALRRLAAALADPTVGVVSGELVLLSEDGSEAGDGVGAYWRYEKWLRRAESDVHSMLGATGAIYAIRTELVEPLPPGTILDDVLVPMRAVLAGRRAVFEPAARAYDTVFSPEREFHRKVRTLMGNYQLLALMPALLSPRRNPVFLQFVSHKIGRLVVPYLLVLLYAANAVLTFSRGGPVYGLAFFAQTAVYLLAVIGSLWAGGAATTDRERTPDVSRAEGVSE